MDQITKISVTIDIEQIAVITFVHLLCNLFDLLCIAVIPFGTIEGFRYHPDRFSVCRKFASQFRAEKYLNIPLPERTPAPELHAIGKAGLRGRARAVDPGGDSEGIIAEVFPDMAPDPVPEDDIGSEMTMERREFLDRTLLVDVHIPATGMVVHVLLLV
jgi:hypothetical protein